MQVTSFPPKDIKEAMEPPTPPVPTTRYFLFALKLLFGILFYGTVCFVKSQFSGFAEVCQGFRFL